MVLRDEAHTAHVCSKRVDLVDTTRRLKALVETTEIPHLELVRVHICVCGTLDVHTSNEMSLPLQKRDKVMPDEPAGSRHQHSRFAPAHWCPLPPPVRLM